MKPLMDRFGRPVRSVRISVTNRCNYRCFFCHREGYDIEGSEMTPQEIERIMRILVRNGVTRAKITGGEPLLRSDIIEIVRGMKRAGIREVSMTTNAWRLGELAEKLSDAGLDRVNISLHSLDSKTYKFITGVNGLERALKGLDEAIRMGLKPKINMVVLRGVNDGEVWRMIEFSVKRGVNLQLIELLDTDIDLFKKYHFSLSGVEKKLRDMAIKFDQNVLHGRPRYYLSKNTYVELVRSFRNPLFCMGCDRIRITHDGKFKACIMRNDNLIDFLEKMRAGVGDEELEKLFRSAVSLREPYYKLGKNPT